MDALKVVNTTVIENNREIVVQAINEFVGKYPSKADAADALGINRVYLWKMIKGDKPISENVLEKLGFQVEVQKVKTYSKRN